MKKLGFLLLCLCCSHGHPVDEKNLNEAKKMEKQLDLDGGILPRTVRQRMARFFTDSASASSASTGNLLDLGLDSNAIMTVRVL